VMKAVPASWPSLFLKSTSRPLFLCSRAEAGSTNNAGSAAMHTLSNLVILFLAYFTR
jgi:hypothetical protein